MATPLLPHHRLALPNQSTITAKTVKPCSQSKNKHLALLVPAATPSALHSLGPAPRKGSLRCCDAAPPRCAAPSVGAARVRPPAALPHQLSRGCSRRTLATRGRALPPARRCRVGAPAAQHQTPLGPLCAAGRRGPLPHAGRCPPGSARWERRCHWRACQGLPLLPQRPARAGRGCRQRGRVWGRGTAMPCP